MPEQLSGAELDAWFFEVCWGWHKQEVSGHESRLYYWVSSHNHVPAIACDAVSTDANACEAWAMRWARERGWVWSTGACDGFTEHWCELEYYSEVGKLHDIIKYGQDWKEAFVRACVAAGLVLNQAKGGA